MCPVYHTMAEGTISSLKFVQSWCLFNSAVQVLLKSHSYVVYIRYIFPGREWCEAYAPTVYKYPVLLPFFWVWRLIYKGITNRKKVTQEIKTIKAGKQNWKIGWEGAHWRTELFYLVRWWALFVCRDIRPVSRLSFGSGKQRKGSHETRRWGRDGEHWGNQKKIGDWSRVIAHSVTFQGADDQSVGKIPSGLLL